MVFVIDIFLYLLIIKLSNNEKITVRINISDDQQGFITGSSCNDVVFVVKQIAEKSLEYNKSAFFCFIDLEKAFDRVQLQGSTTRHHKVGRKHI